MCNMFPQLLRPIQSHAPALRLLLEIPGAELYSVLWETIPTTSW